MDISVVVPLYNEEESLLELFAWIERVMNANGFSYEVIFVNDGSTDRSWQVIEQLQAQAPDKVRGIGSGRTTEVAGIVLWFRTSTRRRRDNHGRRPAGQSRRNTRTLPHDYPGGLRPRIGLEAETLRPCRRPPHQLFNATARKVSGIKNLTTLIAD